MTNNIIKFPVSTEPVEPLSWTLDSLLSVLDSYGGVYVGSTMQPGQPHAHLVRFKDVFSAAAFARTFGPKKEGEPRDELLKEFASIEIAMVEGRHITSFAQSVRVRIIF